MVILKAVLVTVPAALSEQLEGLPKMTLTRACAALRPGEITTPLAAAKHALRELALGADAASLA